MFLEQFSPAFYKQIFALGKRLTERQSPILGF